MYGPNPPVKNNSFHNLSISGYVYRMEMFGYLLYAGKWIKGRSTVKVSINNWRVLVDYSDGKSLTIRIHSSSGKVV